MNRHSSPTRTVRIAVVSRSRILGSALRLLLATHSGFKLVGEGTSYAEAVRAQRVPPDVILLHEEAATQNEVAQFSTLMGAPKTVRLVVLTSAPTPETHCTIVRLGAMGVVRQQDPPEILFRAIECVCAGEVWLDRALVISLLDSRTLGDAYVGEVQRPPVGSLTHREREIVQLVGEALHNRQIAQRLFISEITVRHHLTSIFGKLGVASRLQLAHYAYRCGLAKVQDSSSSLMPQTMNSIRVETR
jgi:two-component system, NarL family, nitrate/nitrite response regulator NarL